MKKTKIVGVALLLALFVALTMGGVCMTFPFTPGTILACWIFAAIVCALSGGFRHGQRIGHMMLWALVAIIAAAMASGFISGIQESATRQVGNSLVAAVEQYQRENGAPPASLDLLVPKYFNSVPATRFGLNGTKFFYHSRTNGFRLGYGLPYFMSRSYDSDTHQWKTMD